VLAAIWPGPSKPNHSEMKEFLELCVLNDLLKLHEGVKIFDEMSNVTFHIRISLVCVSCDKVARCVIQNSIQFNGEFGCSYCEQKGKQHKLSTGGSVRVYPFLENNFDESRRTHDKNLQYGQMAERISKGKQQKVVRGVKGVSFLYKVPNFDCVWDVPIDYMHCVCLGVIKSLFNLWLSQNLCW
jgi:hypothetical protein